MTIDVCTKVGRKIRYLRTAKGMSQDILADRAGISRINLSRIENGKAEVGLRRLCRIAKALGVRVALLVEDLD